MDRHKTIINQICESIHYFHETKTKFRVYHGSTNSTRHVNFDRDEIIDTSSLNQVIEFDLQKKTVIVEPNVPMDALVKATIEKKLLPPVVMEFPGITVGGGFVGTAGESSSFKYGFFDCTVNWAEVVLADGTIVVASATKHPDLFRGMRGSFGTLGVLTLLEIQLVDLKQYVEVTYHPVQSFRESVLETKKQTLQEENDYVEGILFAKNNGAIITGKLLDAYPKTSLQHFTRSWDPWFYLHAKDVLKESPKTPFTEVVPIEDYLFRYDRGAFWTGMYAYKYFMVPFTWITRLLLDYFMHTRIMYHALHASGHSDKYVIQDLAVPISNVETFLEYLDVKFGFYPLWIFPLRIDARESMAHPHQWAKPELISEKKSIGTEPYISIGLWGPGPSSDLEYIKINRELEAKLHDLGGLKWLYARTFYTEKEFWEIYDEPKYTELRQKYNATTLPSIYDKVKDDLSKRGRVAGPGFKGFIKSIIFRSRFLSGIYGIYKALGGGDYLLARKRK
ncbi:FAD-binding domain-containing protein [Zopfia rhizophila CBS 207.26]|uniref:Delta(24)-sterol reductase n=1 Tax=Zopfia rhizophila CBS 207.26 TaxID=1314779 RepID=A0A6A6EN42_9PEZI|nr:FAD-binding domain-containing protein [Zopfia rhizophila CBS 207.26]